MQSTLKKSTLLFLFILTFATIAIFACKEKINNITMGPKKGTLIAIGGAADADIFYDKFAEYAGGKMWSEDKGEYRDLKAGSRLFYFLHAGDRYNLTERRKVLK